MSRKIIEAWKMANNTKQSNSSYDVVQTSCGVAKLPLLVSNYKEVIFSIDFRSSKVTLRSLNRSPSSMHRSCASSINCCAQICWYTSDTSLTCKYFTCRLVPVLFSPNKRPNCLSNIQLMHNNCHSILFAQLGRFGRSAICNKYSNLSHIGYSARLPLWSSR